MKTAAKVCITVILLFALSLIIIEFDSIGDNIERIGNIHRVQTWHMEKETRIIFFDSNDTTAFTIKMDDEQFFGINEIIDWQEREWVIDSYRINILNTDPENPYEWTPIGTYTARLLNGKSYKYYFNHIRDIVENYENYWSY
jgi:hypothetical protein